MSPHRWFKAPLWYHLGLKDKVLCTELSILVTSPGHLSKGHQSGTCMLPVGIQERFP